MCRCAGPTAVAAALGSTCEGSVSSSEEERKYFYCVALWKCGVRVTSLTITAVLYMEHLLATPSDIFVYVICPFLSWSSLCALDVALTSQRLRPLLFDMYPMLSRDHPSSGVGDQLMQWFLKRNISIKSLSFVPSTIDTTLLSLSTHTYKCASLTTLDLSHCRCVTGQ